MLFTSYVIQYRPEWWGVKNVIVFFNDIGLLLIKNESQSSHFEKIGIVLSFITDVLLSTEMLSHTPGITQHNFMRSRVVTIDCSQTQSISIRQVKTFITDSTHW